MLITYFDEVKYQLGAQPYYWLGGLTASAEDIWELETKVSALAQECFGRATLSRETEFHAADIFHRKSNFRDWNDLNARLEIIKRLIDIVNQQENLKKVFVRLEPARMVASDYAEKAFMFFVERTESLLRSQESPGILIGDRDNQKISKDFAESLSQYRQSGTPYQYGTELRCLIDTVHFTDSHHSRMLQLADLHIWIRQLLSTGDRSKYAVQTLVDYVTANNGIVSFNRYKIWPTEQSWLRV